MSLSDAAPGRFLSLVDLAAVGVYDVYDGNAEIAAGLIELIDVVDDVAAAGARRGAVRLGIEMAAVHVQLDDCCTGPVDVIVKALGQRDHLAVDVDLHISTRHARYSFPCA